ncbi:MAG: AAA family ATPase [Aureispira sp.]|nr:AAA family ATPase [Aureispira sp.]
MKLLKVRIKNLNSLKGEFVINFDEAPLKNTGLFVITGSTGAGKSTVLDAITLALFGRVPRFEDMTMTKKTEQIMTYGMEDSYAEVEFRANDGEYRSKWLLSKTKTGNFRPIKRELAKILEGQEDQVLATKIKHIDALIMELLGGLDFKRFTRSVLLAQGEFAQFLKGTEDRSKILERITNSEKYSKISIHAFERHKEEVINLEKLKEKADSVQLLSTEEIEDLETELQGHLGQQKTLQEQSNDLQSQIKWLQQLKKLNIQEGELQESLANLKQQEEEAKERFKQLEEHLKAVVHQPALKELNELNNNIQQTQISVGSIEKNILDLEKNCAEYTNQQAQQTQTVKKLKQELQSSEAVFEKVLRLDAEILHTQKNAAQYKLELNDQEQKLAQQKENFKSLEAEQKQLDLGVQKHQKWLDNNQHAQLLIDSPVVYQLQTYQKDWLNSLSQQEERSKRLKLIQNKLKTSQEQVALSTAAIASTVVGLKQNQEVYAALAQKQAKEDSSKTHQETVKAIQENHINLDELLLNLIELEEEAKRRQATQVAMAEIDEQIENLTIQSGRLDQETLNLDHQQQEVDQLVSYKELVHQEQLKKQSLEQHRHQLKEGEECPLCFSKEHPFRKSDLDINIVESLAKKELDQAKQQKKKIDQAIQQLINKQSEILQKINNLQSNKEKLIVELYASEHKIQDFIEDNDMDIDLLLHEENTLPEQIQSTKKLIAEQRQLLEKLQDLHYTIQQQENEVTNNRNQLQFLEEQAEDYKQEIQELEDTLATLHKNLEEQKNLIGKTLKPFDKKVVLKQLDSTIKELEQTQKHYQNHLDLKEETQKKLQLVQSKVTTTQAQLKELKEQVQARTTVWEAVEQQLIELKEERKELFGDKNPQTERQRLQQLINRQELLIQQLAQQLQEANKHLSTQQGSLGEKKKQLSKYQKSHSTNLAQLLKALHTIGFESIEELKEVILSEQEAQKLQETRQLLNERINQTTNRLTEIATELQEMQKNPATKEEQTALEEKYQLLQVELKTTLENTGVIKQKLQHHQEQKDRHQQLLDAISQQKKEVHRWNKLNEFIGSKSGKKFRTFAQSITLNQLIHLANKHLSYFVNGRYHLEKRQGETLELDIVDTFQANNKRPLNTLSGGESFLASLALALGLSDLASGKARIESLFIDEGFGTLDQETLQVALNALQSLQAKGKMIGIISHVAQLKRAIPTQVQITKRGGGFSEIKVVET